MSLRFGLVAILLALVATPTLADVNQAGQNSLAQVGYKVENSVVKSAQPNVAVSAKARFLQAVITLVQDGAGCLMVLCILALVTVLSTGSSSSSLGEQDRSSKTNTNMSSLGIGAFFQALIFGFAITGIASQGNDSSKGFMDEGNSWLGPLGVVLEAIAILTLQMASGATLTNVLEGKFLIGNKFKVKVSDAGQEEGDLRSRFKVWFKDWKTDQKEAARAAILEQFGIDKQGSLPANVDTIMEDENPKFGVFVEACVNHALPKDKEKDLVDFKKFAAQFMVPEKEFLGEATGLDLNLPISQIRKTILDYYGAYCA